MSSNNKSPIFPFPQPQHFTDYVFDPQVDYFQKNILEETRKHKSLSRSLDAFRFKPQKPISKEDISRKFKKSGGRKRWWKSALLFFKWNTTAGAPPVAKTEGDSTERGANRNRARVRSVYGPVYYISDSRSGSGGKPYRTTGRPSSTPLAGTLSPSGKGEVEIPYVSLRDLNMEKQQYYRMPAPSSTLPVYLVT
ncbi:PREDICTED: uncharacterized protein LOC109183827 [Ipomoea nil]|uniref:uncharacterized protein LOC109183827 n=1 Tax=Ipomoea nil TaxID=35883 RepID=UPI000900D863|nr:PREDICTED: uncharacterized protein LOC109183827 [Ipomoea nil]